MKLKNIMPMIAKAFEISSAIKPAHTIKPAHIINNVHPIVKMNLFTANTLKLIADASQITSSVQPKAPQ